MKIIHKSGSTLTNADGLSRCTAAITSDKDSAIKLDAISTLEEDDYADACEILLESEGEVSGEIMVVNLLAKYMKSFPCKVCNHMIGENKAK
jgi:hypothetical protein